MGVVGWMLLLLSQMMVPVASQKPPGLSVGVVMGQTRHLSDQQLRPPRRPDDALDVSVVILRMNQTDPKSVITQVRDAEPVTDITHKPSIKHTHRVSFDTWVCFTVSQGVWAPHTHSSPRHRVCRWYRSGGHCPDPWLPLRSDATSSPGSPWRLLYDYGWQGEWHTSTDTDTHRTRSCFFGYPLFVLWRLGSCNPVSQSRLNVRIMVNAF